MANLNDNKMYLHERLSLSRYGNLTVDRSIDFRAAFRVSYYSCRNFSSTDASILCRPICSLQIRPSDSLALRQKLAQVRAIVDQELGFVEAPPDMDQPSRMAYLCIVEKRVVGMVLVESIAFAYRLLALSTPRGHDYTVPALNDRRPTFAWERSTEPHRAVLGIYQLWVHAQHRQCGIATALVDTARTHFVFGYHNVPLNRLAFSSPTESGVRFAQHYHCIHRPQAATPASSQPFDDVEVMVYDCC
jgi:ribosomal protein S18 acetylase RimI-like enzyme